MQILKTLLDGRPLVHHGAHYDIEVAPPRMTTVSGRCPPLYFGGLSEDARDAAAQGCDVYLMWPDTMPAVRAIIADMTARAAKYGRTLKFGYRAHVIVRETEAEARAYATRLLSRLDAGTGDAIPRDRSIRPASGSSARPNCAPRGRRGFVEDNLWTGIGRARCGCGAAIVGDPDQVLAKLRAYQAEGIEAFILSGYPPRCGGRPVRAPRAAASGSRPARGLSGAHVCSRHHARPCPARCRPARRLRVDRRRHRDRADQAGRQGGRLDDDQAATRPTGTAGAACAAPNTTPRAPVDQRRERARALPPRPAGARRLLMRTHRRIAVLAALLLVVPAALVAKTAMIPGAKPTAIVAGRLPFTFRQPPTLRTRFDRSEPFLEGEVAYGYGGRTTTPVLRSGDEVAPAGSAAYGVPMRRRDGSAEELVWCVATRRAAKPTVGAVCLFDHGLGFGGYDALMTTAAYVLDNDPYGGGAITEGPFDLGAPVRVRYYIQNVGKIARIKAQIWVGDTMANQWGYQFGDIGRGAQPAERLFGVGGGVIGIAPDPAAKDHYLLRIVTPLTAGGAVPLGEVRNDVRGIQPVAR